MLTWCINSRKHWWCGTNRLSRYYTVWLSMYYEPTHTVPRHKCEKITCQSIVLQVFCSSTLFLWPPGPYREWSNEERSWCLRTFDWVRALEENVGQVQLYHWAHQGPRVQGRGQCTQYQPLQDSKGTIITWLSSWSGNENEMFTITCSNKMLTCSCCWYILFTLVVERAGCQNNRLCQRGKG